MSNTRSWATIGAAGLITTVLIFTAAGPALGQPPIEVVAKSSLTRHVPYGDLGLATKQGQNTLYRRVSAAVQDLCPMTAEDGRWYDFQDCRQFAWRGARPQINQAVDRATSGSSLAMTSSITIAVAK
jgi:UrcA family protein